MTVTNVRGIAASAIVWVLLSVAIVPVSPVRAEEHSSGAATARTFWRSHVLGSSLSSETVQTYDPTGILAFPDVAAEIVQPVLHAGAGLISDGTAGGGIVGGAYPGQRAVWSAVGAFYDDTDGSLWRGDLGVSRRVGLRTAAGVSGTVQLADGTDGLDLGAGFNVGAGMRVGGFLPGLRIHGALRNVGKTARRYDGEVPLFPAFTPAIGAQFSPLRGERVSLDIGAAAAFDRFQGLSIDGTGTLRFGDGLYGVIGWWHRIGSGEDGQWPGVSVSIGIPLSGKDRSRAHISTQPRRDGTVDIAGGISVLIPSTDTTPPRISVTMREPASDRGGSDDTVLLGAIQDSRQMVLDFLVLDDRSVGTFTGSLLGPDGESAREWLFAPRGGNIPSGDIASRLTSPLGITTFGGTIVWGSGDSIGDGFYVLRLSATDAAGNTSAVTEIDILVDTTAPQIVLGEERIDDRSSEQTGIPDERGDVVLSGDGTYTMSFRVRDVESVAAVLLDEAERELFPLLPELIQHADESGFYDGTVTWSGTGSDGGRLDQGAYRVRVEAADLFGNQNAVTGTTVLLQQQEPRFNLALSDDRAAPNGDGYRDEITVTTRIEPLVGLREWRLRLVNLDSGEVTASWSGIDLPPNEIAIGGGELPRDGRYKLEGESVYENGAVATVVSRTVTVDRESPVIQLAVSNGRVRPEQGRETTLYFEGDGTVFSSRIIVSSPTASVDSFVLAEFDTLPEMYTWYLADRDGDLLSPGIYRIVVEAEDRTGNITVSEYRDVVLQERLGGVAAVPVTRVFSPNGDGVLDTAQVMIDGPENLDGDFFVEIVDEEGAVKRRVGGVLPLPESIVWDGRDDEGVPIGDGIYGITIVIEVDGVAPIRSASVRVRVDTTPPFGTVTIRGDGIISPDGDGVKDTLSFMLQPDSAEPLDQLQRTFVVSRLEEDGTSRSVTVAAPELRVGEIEWLPRTESDTVLPDGTYTVGVRLVDSAGNARLIESDAIKIDTRPIGAFLRIDEGAINPLGSPARAIFAPVLPDPDGLSEWTLEIVNLATDQRVFETGRNDGELPQPIHWPESASERPSDGRYEARFRASYSHGPVVERRSPAVVVDSSGPELSVVLDPVPFSPDGDGYDDVLTFSIDASDNSAIGYWYLEVYDPRGNFFYDAGGEGIPPADVRWDGQARNGESVFSAETYTWRLEVGDVLGNTTVREGELPVDILVTPYRGGFRIQIPSITFAPNSAELILSGDDVAARQNRSVLDRLVEILRRYPEYRIVVEGHAVNVTGTQREQEEELIPLSSSRARTVRDALVTRGVPAGMLAARGRGGEVPIVPHTDEDMRWKNRRVDFILERE